jgi:hypothetical protein
MQARRRAVWLVLGALALLTLTSPVAPWVVSPDAVPLAREIATWAIVVNLFMPLGVGLLLADRLPRDQRVCVRDLLATLSASSGARLIGKVLGALLGTLPPVLLLYAIGIGIVIARWGQPASVLALAVAAFATVMLPGLLFVGACSIACTAVLWPPLYQFLFIGYWFWGNALSPSYHIPTLSTTILTPLGGASAAGFFGAPWPLHPDATPATAVASITLLLVVAACALVLTGRYLEWRAARQ